MPRTSGQAACSEHCFCSWPVGGEDSPAPQTPSMAVAWRSQFECPDTGMFSGYDESSIAYGTCETPLKLIMNPYYLNSSAIPKPQLLSRALSGRTHFRYSHRRKSASREGEGTAFGFACNLVLPTYSDRWISNLWSRKNLSDVVFV
jgi:hypothetical protein